MKKNKPDSPAKLERNEFLKLFEPIVDSTPEQVAKAILKSPPKKEWRFWRKNQ